MDEPLHWTGLPANSVPHICSLLTEFKASEYASEREQILGDVCIAVMNQLRQQGYLHGAENLEASYIQIVDEKDFEYQDPFKFFFQYEEDLTEFYDWNY